MYSVRFLVVKEKKWVVIKCCTLDKAMDMAYALKDLPAIGEIGPITVQNERKEIVFPR